MSNSGVKTGFAKCCIFFMAVIILLQGVLYLGLSIWGIILRKCNQEAIDIGNKRLQFAMDLTYFLNENCGKPSIKVPDLSKPITLDIDFEKARLIENRTLILLITYTFISTLWIMTSLTIISTLFGSITKNINRLCFWPWFLVVMAGSILDTVATGYHIYDITNTTTMEKTFKYFGMKPNDEIIKVLSKFDAYSVTPAVIMASISCRVLIIWLLNIIGSSFCLCLSNSLLKRSNSSRQCSNTSLASTSTYPITNAQQQSLEDISDMQAQQSTTSQQSNQHSTHPQPPTVIIPKLYQIDSLTNTAVTTTNNTDQNADKPSYPPQYNILQYPQELSPLSPLNSRYSTATESFQFSKQNQNVSQELRGQLPWSYTSMPLANKSQMEVYPDIPAPDYGQSK